MKIKITDGSVHIKSVWRVHSSENAHILRIETRSKYPQVTSVTVNPGPGIREFTIEPERAEFTRAHEEDRDIGPGTEIAFDLNSITAEGENVDDWRVLLTDGDWDTLHIDDEDICCLYFVAFRNSDGFHLPLLQRF